MEEIESADDTGRFASARHLLRHSTCSESQRVDGDQKICLSVTFIIGSAGRWSLVAGRVSVASLPPEVGSFSQLGRRTECRLLPCRADRRGFVRRHPPADLLNNHNNEPCALAKSFPTALRACECDRACQAIYRKEHRAVEGVVMAT